MQNSVPVQPCDVSLHNAHLLDVSALGHTWITVELCSVFTEAQMSQQKYHQEFKPPPEGSVTGVQGQEQVSQNEYGIKFNSNYSAFHT